MGVRTIFIRLIKGLRLSIYTSLQNPAFKMLIQIHSFMAANKSKFLERK